MLLIKTKRLCPEAILPGKAYPGDAGWDFFSAVSVTITSGELASVKTGISLAIPLGWCLVLKSRSGLASHGYTVEAGVIDAGYRGEVVVLLRAAVGLAERTFKAGTRIAQGLLIAVPDAVFQEEEIALSPCGRGNQGFGSSG